ncbi:MAG: hypothetical protein U9Q79_11835, partial [Candidatus Hydrogenedentes bacterium]|nr:hypothetical protein [Candidatus Hydrogenedentota bacterium]
VFGALGFYAFWLLYVLGALRRLIQMRTSPRLWLIAGLFAGVFAFLLHAVVDFDFFNPSLATAAFLLAAIFYAATENTARQAPTCRYARPIALVFLVLAAIVFAASLRVHRADALAGSEPEFRTKLLAAQFFVFQAPEQYANDRQGANILLRDAIAIIPDLEGLKECGSFWVTEPGKTPRKLSPYEHLYPDAFLKVTNPEAARGMAIRGVKEALARLKDADRIFPHDPIRAVQISTWCDFLSEASPSDKKRLEWSNQAVEWAQAALDRSPHEAWFHEQYGAALWSRAQITQEPEAQLADFFKSLEHYQQTTVLFPSSALVWGNYAQKLQQLGDILIQYGQTEKGEAFQKKAEEMAKRARKIRSADRRANRRRAGLE